MSPTHALRRVRTDDHTLLPFPHPHHGRAERRADWELQLRRTLKEWSTRSFEWGRSDCVHFVCACIETMTGTNYLADIDTYANEREALEILAAADHRGLQHAVEISLGAAEDVPGNPVSFHTGDIVLTMRPVIGAPHRRGPGLGVCFGSNALFIGANGLEEVAVSNCLCGWRI